jgi:hypothetical protein
MANGVISGPPQVDFYSMLSGLGDTIQKNAKLQQEQGLRDALKDGIPKRPDGSTDLNAIGDIAARHGADLNTTLSIAQLAEAQRRSDQELAASKEFRASIPGIIGGKDAPETPAPTTPFTTLGGRPVPVRSTSKVWGDKEAEDAGLYEKPAAPVQVAQAGQPPAAPLSLAPSAPQAAAPPSPPRLPAAPPAVAAPAPAQPGVTVPEKGIDLSDKIPALVAASSNPRLPAQDRELAKTLLAQAFTQNKEGSDIEKYRFAVNQGFRGSLIDFENILKRPMVNVDNRGESAQAVEVGKAKGKAQAADIEAGNHAMPKLRQLATLDNANKAGGDDISSGPFGELMLKGKQGLNEIAGEDLTNVAPSEVIKKIGFGLATNLTKAITQRPAQQEFMKALENVPNLMMSKTGRTAMTSIMTQEARAEQEIGRLAARHKDVEGGPVWQEAKDKYYEDHPLMSPFTGKPFTPSDIQMIVKSVPPTDGNAPSGAQAGVTRSDVMKVLKQRPEFNAPAQ